MNLSNGGVMEFKDVMYVTQLSKITRVAGTDTWAIEVFPDAKPLTLDDLKSLHKFRRVKYTEEEM